LIISLIFGCARKEPTVQIEVLSINYDNESSGTVLVFDIHSKIKNISDVKGSSGDSHWLAIQKIVFLCSNQNLDIQLNGRSAGVDLPVPEPDQQVEYHAFNYFSRKNSYLLAITSSNFHDYILGTQKVGEITYTWNDPSILP